MPRMYHWRVLRSKAGYRVVESSPGKGVGDSYAGHCPEDVPCEVIDPLSHIHNEVTEQ
jgi:hypothetical protein